MDKMFPKTNKSVRASASDACFAAAVCLIMMGTISLVSIILLVGVLLLGVSVFVPHRTVRKCTMAV